MKKTTMLNSQISYVIAKMGHMDTLTISDVGLPIPNGVERIDLALCKGIPKFLDVLNALLTELEVQKVTIASEMKTSNAELYATLEKMFENVVFEEIPHEEFKVRTRYSKAVVRSGECLPYANIIIESGVTF